MIFQTGTSTTGLANVDEAFALRARDPGGPNPFFLNSITGTLVAASNGDVFAMRLDPSAPQPAHITSISCWYRTITAFTTPATFRQMRLRRFAGTVASGGTAIAVAARKDTAGATSEVDSANGGDARISTTGVLTSPGTPDTLEAGERVTLTNYGAAGANAAWTWVFAPADGATGLLLAAGMSVAIGTAAAFDAAGTWELGVHIEWFEGRRQG
jgi:hypothetical protein